MNRYMRYGIIAGVALFAIMVWWYAGSQIMGSATPKAPSGTVATTGVNWWYVSSGVILLALAVAALFGRGGAFGQWVLGGAVIFFACLFGFNFLFEEKAPEVAAEWRKEAVSVAKGTVKAAPVAPTETKKKITAIDVVIPANGVVRVRKKERCAVDSFTKEYMELGIVLKEKGDSVYYGSRHQNEIRGKIWFFDEGGDCVEDYQRLLAAKAFI